MSVYKYRVTIGKEDFEEEGTVVAKDESEAREKLRILEFTSVSLKKLTGLKAAVKKFTADIR